MSYNYKEGKKRVDEILKNNLEVINNNYLPKSDDLTFNNAYDSWIGSIFIDIRNSTSLFKNNNNEKISKIMKCFSSELIEILRNDYNLRDIGIRGDCIYAIYTVPKKDDFYELYVKSAYCNTYLKMLNKLLLTHKISTFKAGIGLGASKTLVIKAGRKNVGINDKIWIGKSVIDASNFSSIANTNEFNNIVMSPLFYNNLSDVDNNVRKYFNLKTSKFGKCYSGYVIIPDYNKWINNDFKE